MCLRHIGGKGSGPETFTVSRVSLRPRNFQRSQRDGLPTWFQPNEICDDVLKATSAERFRQKPHVGRVSLRTRNFQRLQRDPGYGFPSE